MSFFRIRLSPSRLGVGIGPLYVSGSSRRRRSSTSSSSGGVTYGEVAGGLALMAVGLPLASIWSNTMVEPGEDATAWWIRTALCSLLTGPATLIGFGAAALIIYLLALGITPLARTWIRRHPSRRTRELRRQAAAAKLIADADRVIYGEEPLLTPRRNFFRLVPGDVIVHDLWGYGLVGGVSYGERQSAVVRFDSGRTETIDVGAAPIAVAQRAGARS